MNSVKEIRGLKCPNHEYDNEMLGTIHVGVLTGVPEEFVKTLYPGGQVEHVLQ